MSLFSVLSTALNLWIKYGNTAEKAINVFNKLAAIDNGTLFAQVEEILLEEGINVQVIMNDIANAAANAPAAPVVSAQPADPNITVPSGNPYINNGPIIKNGEG